MYLKLHALQSLAYKQLLLTHLCKQINMGLSLQIMQQHSVIHCNKIISTLEM